DPTVGAFGRAAARPKAYRILYNISYARCRQADGEALDVRRGGAPHPAAATFSAGRSLDKADDNEFVLLEVGEFLKAE
ncbi:hypothetical protein, partial [Sinorhizobium meliloti]|uniref:hypothetical protein n=2 Tax=Rhizobium meliloti TaxID=382 RepID=UPI001AECADA5